jgi:[ribosomal protein S5]-alanine N-acetyltransferase
MNSAPELPVLGSAQLRLRPYRLSDAADLFALYSDAMVTRYWSHAPWEKHQQAETYLTERMALETPAVYAWAIADKASDRLIGTTTLFSLNGPQARAEVGYALHPDYQGRGLAQEALRTVLSYAFDVLQLERIEADIDPRNTASCRLVERLGFKQEGLLRNRWRVNGEICDSAYYGLLKNEFIRA